MAKKTIGYVELEWTCKRCQTKNPGTQKTCSNCGAAMDEQDQFELPAQQELITDEAKLAQAQKGADIHCPYCEARNPAGTQVCTQCGGDLTDAQARQKGQVMGAYSTQTAAKINCPACNTPNPPNAARCQNCGASLVKEPKTTVAPPTQQAVKPNRTLLILAGAFIAILCLSGILFMLFASRSEAQTAVVQSVRWARSIEILDEKPVEREGWQDQIPADADEGACTEKYRYTQSEPAPGAEEVCGTPYTVDQGSGIAEVVQDCEYRIYDDWCSYTQMEWVVVDTESLQGNDTNPVWPSLQLGAERRLGESNESYTVVFLSDGETYTYQIDSPDEFSLFIPGSEWTIEVNTFGTITNIQEK
jgi:DNA-directed RNA polymerase subunit RPC12/RpoP